MRQLAVFLMISLFCLLLLGCGGDTAVSTPTHLAQLPTETASHTPSPSPTNTATPAPTATQTRQTILTRIPTYTPMPTTTAMPTPLPKPDPSELLTRLITAWEQGLTPSAIRPELESEGWIPRADDEIIPKLWDANSLQWLVTDLDGDGSDEWLISVLVSDQFDSCSLRNIGELWIINGDALVFKLSFQEEYPFWNVPMIIGQADLTGDGIADVVTQSIGCSAHTNFAMYHVLSGHYGQIENILNLNNNLEELAKPVRSLGSDYDPNTGWSTAGVAISKASQELYDATGDGIIDLVITGGTFNSAGAGYNRGRTEIWAWDGTNLTLSNIEYSQTDERIHGLFDANFAFLLGDLESAQNLYLEVIENDGLGDSVAIQAVDGGYSDAQKFAAFRLALLHLIENNLDSAREWENWLETEYPSSPMKEATTALLVSWQQSGSLTQACTDVRILLDGYDQPTGSLSYTGYGNPTINAEDVCPENLEN